MSAAEMPASGAPTEATEITHRWWILAVAALAQVMLVLDTTIVNIALPDAQKSLHFANSDQQWIVTAYALAFGSLLLIGGRIGDVLGRKRVFLGGLIGFALASAIGGAAPDFAVLAAARALQGVFGALLAPAALSIVAITFAEPAERAKAFGIYGAIAGGGGSIGLLLGGVLTSYVDWRWCLFVNLVFAVIAGVGGFLLLKDGPGPIARESMSLGRCSRRLGFSASCLGSRRRRRRVGATRQRSSRSSLVLCC